MKEMVAMNWTERFKITFGRKEGKGENNVIIF